MSTLHRCAINLFRTLGKPPSALLRCPAQARRLDGSVYDVSLPGKRAGPSSSPVSLELPRAPGGDAVVKLRRFDARAAADVAGALARAEAGGAGRVILDLRSNRGGLVTEGVEVASLFLAGAFDGREAATALTMGRLQRLAPA